VNNKWIYLLVVICSMTTALVAQQDFSATVVDQRPGRQTNPTKVYVTKDKVRFESTQPSGHSGVVILNLTAQTSDILMPERKIYIESVAGQGPYAQQKWTFFRIADVDNACADWQKIPSHQDGTCQKVGHETVNGRNTVKYTGTSKDGDTVAVWIDSKVAFPIKWENKNGGGGELQDIKEGSQPASLFEIPSDYQKMEMPGGMRGVSPQR
jgi:hypothetical protein